MNPRLSLSGCLGLAVLLLTSPSAAFLGDCGQPATNGPSPAASDCLFVLRTAVGTSECPICVCDTTGAGGVLASDALLCLRVAVGQPLALNCPPCDTTTTTIPVSTTTTTLPDLDPPSILSASATGPTTVEIVFDEAVVPSSIEVGNIFLDGGAAAIAVELQPDTMTAVVTTTQLAANTTYTVIVAGVTDLAGNTITTPGNTALFMTGP